MWPAFYCSPQLENYRPIQKKLDKFYETKYTRR